MSIQPLQQTGPPSWFSALQRPCRRPGSLAERSASGSWCNRLEAITFHVTKVTEILRPSGDGKQSAAQFTDLNGGCKVVVSYPAPLVTGDPPNVPATRVILLQEAK